MTAIQNDMKRGFLLRLWLQVTRNRFCVLICMGAFLVFASFGFSVDFMSSWLYWLVRCMCGLLAGVFGFLYMRTSRSVTRLSKPRKPEDNIALIPLAESQSQKLQLRAVNEDPIGLAEAKIFALATIYPSTIRQRISERHEPERRTVRQSVTMALKIPRHELGLLNGSARRSASQQRAKQASIPIPVLILPKGELNDDLSVYGSGDEPIPTYSYSEYLQLAARVLHVLVVGACTLPGKEETFGHDTLEPMRDAEDAAMRCIMHRGKLNVAELENAITSIKGLPLPAEMPEEQKGEAGTLLYLASRLVEKLSTHYAIVVAAACQADGRISVRYERTVIPSLRLSARQGDSKGISFVWISRWMKDRIRLLLGARPVKLTVSLENACTCQSFHMLVSCPEGLYLRNQDIPGVNEYLQHNARQTNVAPYCRLRRRLGQPYAHFYSRYFPEPKKKRSDIAGSTTDSGADLSSSPPQLHLVFQEVPPASMFRAALVAVSTMLLLWLVGVVISHAGDGDPGTDAPAILLAFPAIIATWLGFDSPSRRLLEGTLASRLSLSLSAFLAVAGSGLFMVYKAKLGLLHGNLPVHISILGIGQISWAILVIISVFNGLYASYFCIMRTWEFARLSSRDIMHSTISQGG